VIENARDNLGQRDLEGSEKKHGKKEVRFSHVRGERGKKM